MYKLARNYSFYYMDSKSPSFRLSTHEVTDSSNPLANTLAPAYSSDKVFGVSTLRSTVDFLERCMLLQSKMFYAAYNDEQPFGDSSRKYGHTKGFVLSDGTLGFWLVHSVPKFPSCPEKYQFPKSGWKYGQIFMCVSIKDSNLDEVG